MKISLRWLSDYIDVNEYFKNPQGLAQILTGAGIEVEGIEDQSVKYQNVVTGRIEVLGRHPDAEKLTLCQVDVGDGKLRQIICGAKNHSQGDRVVVALPGAVLPGDFAIKISKIRGVESQGMLCSESELGLQDESEGILLLPKDAPLGSPFAQFMGLDDVILELSVTPNRADCLSHWGLARELSALLNRPLKKLPVELKKSQGSTQERIQLVHQDTESCPRYAGRILTGIQVGPSPDWMKRRLQSVGMNSINNVVDITNYVMLELGQPLHAFDTRHLNGNKVIISRSTPGETFVTLDGTELKLTGEELTIRDGKGPVALAGVVGGKNSGVEESTTEVFLESAHFLPDSVRKTSRRLGVETESSYRFSRGTDPDAVDVALERASVLLSELASGVPAQDHYDSYPSPKAAPVIECRLSYISERLGYAADGVAFVDWMKRLGCQVSELGSGRHSVQPPRFRWDIQIEEDLVEEYARLQGYDQIPDALPGMAQAPGQDTPAYGWERELAQVMLGLGYSQAVNYNFIGEKFLQDTLALPSGGLQLGVEISDQWVRIKNPLSEDLGVMRPSLIPTLLKSLTHNNRYGREHGRLFEIGTAFAMNGAEAKESLRLAMVGWGHRVDVWDKAETRPVVFELKGAVEALLGHLKSSAWSWKPLSADAAFLHPAQSAELFYEGRSVGYLGTLHPELKESFKLRSDVAVVELDVASLMRGQPRKPKLKPLSKFQAVTRDFAFLVPDSISAGEVLQQVQKAGGATLQRLDVFDVFRGGSVPEGHASVAIRATFQSLEDTLTEAALTELQQKVMGQVTEKLGLKVR